LIESVKSERPYAVLIYGILTSIGCWNGSCF